MAKPPLQPGQIIGKGQRRKKEIKMTEFYHRHDISDHVWALLEPLKSVS